MKGKFIGTLALLLATSSMLACGSDDDDGGGGEAAKASCNAYCDATIASGCPDSADCKSFECEGVEKAGGPCATEMKRYYDCMKAQANVCDQTCTLDFEKCK